MLLLVLCCRRPSWWAGDAAVCAVGLLAHARTHDTHTHNRDFPRGIMFFFTEVSRIYVYYSKSASYDTLISQRVDLFWAGGGGGSAMTTTVVGARDTCDNKYGVHITLYSYVIREASRLASATYVGALPVLVLVLVLVLAFI